MEKKIYSVWTKVETWRREDFLIDGSLDKEEVIRLAINEEFDVDDYYDEGWSEDWRELEPEEINSSYKITKEIFCGDKMIWNNKPIEYVREEKLLQLLGDISEPT
jgi:hypothetical protein